MDIGKPDMSRVDITAELRRKLLAISPNIVNDASELMREAALNGIHTLPQVVRVEGPIDVVDMFAGCGGMSAGFQSINSLLPAYRLALAIDVDPVANATYEKNLKLRPEQADIGLLASDMDGTVKKINKCRQSKENPLVMIGCAPCQGFSSHRNAKGSGDERNSLFVAFAKIAAAVGPDVVICENVPELLTDRHWENVREAKRLLEEVGYKVRVDVHDMAAFGVPQQRFRAVVIAMKQDFALPMPFLKKENYRTVRQAIEHLPEIEPGERAECDNMHFTVRHRPTTITTISQVPRDGGKLPKGAGPACLQRAEARSGRAAYEDVYGRLWWDRPAITITAHARNPASGRYVHPEQDRGLSVREAALLQSFPKDYSFEGTLDACFRQIGNAVPPAFSAALAAHILTQLTFGKVGGDHEGYTRAIGPSFSRLIPAIKAGHRQLEKLSA